jgi:hypothetical protein
VEHSKRLDRACNLPKTSQHGILNSCEFTSYFQLLVTVCKFWSLDVMIHVKIQLQISDESQEMSFRYMK